MRITRGQLRKLIRESMSRNNHYYSLRRLLEQPEEDAPPGEYFERLKNGLQGKIDALADHRNIAGVVSFITRAENAINALDTAGNAWKSVNKEDLANAKTVTPQTGENTDADQ